MKEAEREAEVKEVFDQVVKEDVRGGGDDDGGK